MADDKPHAVRGADADNDGDEDEEEEEEENELPPLRKVEPLYCGVCGLPAEYCKWGSKFERCKPWLREHAADLYEPGELDPSPGAETEAAPVSETAESMEAVTLRDGEAGASGEEDDKGKKKVTFEGVPAPKKGGKKALPAEVIISTVQRNKRKSITVITGLDMFENLKIADLAKIWGKRFACGCSVVKNAQNRDQIDIQGDVKHEIAESLAAQPYNVPRNAIFFIEGKKKEKVRALDSDDEDDE